MSQGFSEAPDLEFEYSDADKWTVELSGESALAPLLLLSSVIISQIINKLQTTITCCFPI